MERMVVGIFESLAFHPRAEVLVTECGHQHVRPTGMKKVGEMLFCPFCDDEAKADAAHPKTRITS